MKTSKDSTIAILGISNNTERYSNKAYQRLLKNGYNNLVGITPKSINLPNIEMVSSLSEINFPVHTLSVYLGKERLTPLTDEIMALAPKRIIFNLGTENEQLILEAKQNGVEVIEGCTLVLLSTEQF